MNLYQCLEQTMSAGEDAVLVTVETSNGSTPRKTGARMAVTAGGRVVGTVGGGAVEHQCVQTALEVLSSRVSKKESYPLHPAGEKDLGMICGGEVTVSFRFLPGGEESAAWVNQEQTRLHPAGRVYIFGGGHVSQALVPALSAVEFRCVVLEDRPEFCRPELFAGADETRLISFAQLTDAVELTEEDWVVIVTRGHKDDLLVQSQVMRSPVRYIGVIGSRQKTAGVTAALREMGFTDHDFERVYAPIGLPIRSETPAEIAVSITAQLILERAGGLTKEGI